MSLMSLAKKKSVSEIPPCLAVIAAAGSSRRMDGLDKIYLNIHGAPVLAHSIEAFQSCYFINEIVLVVREDRLSSVTELCSLYNFKKVTSVVIGGDTRVESVLNGIYASEMKAELVAIHDGARPCVDKKIIEQAVSAAAKFHAVAPGLPISSTVKRASDGIVLETVDREGLYEIQTPQVFTADLIKAALTNAIKKSIDITDDCMAAELIGFPVHITQGSRNNIKLTTVEDIIFAEAILKEIIVNR